MANTIANSADTRQQINWVGVRGNRTPIDSSSVMISYTELLQEINDVEHGTLYGGQYTAVSNTSYNKPYFISYDSTNAYVAHELELKESADNTRNDIVDIEETVSRMNTYLYSGSINDEEVTSLAVTYLYSYTTALQHKIDTLWEEINNTHRKLLSILKVDETKHNIGNGYRIWLSLEEGVIKLNTDQGNAKYLLWSNDDITTANYTNCLTNNTYIEASECPENTQFTITCSSGESKYPYFAIPVNYVTLLDESEGWQINWKVDDAEYNNTHNDSIHHFAGYLKNEDGSYVTDESGNSVTFMYNNWMYMHNITINDYNYYVFRYSLSITETTEYIYYKNI